MNELDYLSEEIVDTSRECVDDIYFLKDAIELEDIDKIKELQKSLNAKLDYLLHLYTH
jgi:hypothetical protein